MSIVGRGADQFTVRFPDGMRDRIKAAAEANNRSMNAEIVATLGEKYPEPVNPYDILPTIEEIAEQLKAMPKGPEWAALSRGLIRVVDQLQEALDQSNDNQ